MKNWKKMLVASLACSAVLGFSYSPAEAAYELNPEVKTATPALMEASEIGVLKYENPQLQNLTNKDAIVVASFGTTFKETREKTIEATVRDIQAAYPEVKVVTAFTSHIIIDRIAKNEGVKYPTPEEALAQLKARREDGRRAAQVDDMPRLQEVIHRVGIAGQSSSRSEDGIGHTHQLLDSHTLTTTEDRFAVLGKHIRDALAEARLDEDIRIDEASPESFGQMSPDGTLTRAHEADEEDGGVHTTSCRGKRCARGTSS